MQKGIVIISSSFFIMKKIIMDNLILIILFFRPIYKQRSIPITNEGENIYESF